MKLFSLHYLTPFGLLLALTTAPALATQTCETLTGCEQKACQIEQQLAIAEEKGNQHKVNGLQKALKANQKNCTDKGLRKKMLGDIAESKQEIAEDQKKLNKAKADGKPHKVRKYQQEIKKEQQRINRLEQKLLELN